ncbi:hypothetical protein GCM10029963_53530 [Micromonospora andamanensis]|uniref:hypothetical protein n=1 Tax=Micromonospora andamanensis TaxID=1287068 RepID=UPI00194F204D|nr:hypothetical protein [Micromonospora andamanensis]GIJ36714.1 hypothetical protein Vwe01_00390 [Micromonospora andamanensis]
MTAYDRTPPGTTVRLVIPEATIVSHGHLQMRVTLPDHPGDVVALPLVDEHFRPLVEIHPYVPALEPGQTWRGADGTLLHSIHYRREPDDAGGTFLIAPITGLIYGPELAVDEFGPLTLLAERPAYDETWLPPAPVALEPAAPAPPPPVSPAAPAISDTVVLPRIPAEEAR